MKNLEKIGSASEVDSAVAEMEVDTPSMSSMISEPLKLQHSASEEKTDSAVDPLDNGVTTNKGEHSDSDIPLTCNGVDASEGEGNLVRETAVENSKVSASIEPVEINGNLSETVDTPLVTLDAKCLDTTKECNGEVVNGSSTLENVEQEMKNSQEPKVPNGDISVELAPLNNKPVEENTVVNGCEMEKQAESDVNDSSLKSVDNTHNKSDPLNKEEVFKMPNSIEELLDEEVLKDDISEVSGIDKNEVFNETDTSKEDSVGDMEVEFSKETAESNVIIMEDNVVNNIKKSEANEESKSVSEALESSVTEVMESSDTEKLMSEDKVDVETDDNKDQNDTSSVKENLNPFVDETTPEVDETKEDGINVDDNELAAQISLETVDQGSDEENSDDDLDINAGLDKCFSALEKEISKDEPAEDPFKSEDININKKPEDSKKEKEKTFFVDDSSRETMDVSNVPSEAEEGGNEADDEEDKERASEEPETEPVDLDQALGELEQIEKTTRRIMDDESESLKRPNEESIEPATKKAKIDESLEETVDAVKKKKLKKELKKMSRNDLEDLIANKMVEVMTNKSEIGKLRHQCDSFQETVEKWKRRAQALSKQCTDLSTVMRKYITDSKNRPRDKVAPVRITRSVGLQVMTPDQRRMQQQRQNMSRLNRSQDKAVAPGAVQHNSQAKTASSNMNVAKQSNGLAKAVSPQLPRTVGGTTISPAKSTATPIRSTNSVTITQTKTPSTSSTPKPVIDIVDLSDDESSPVPAPAPTPPAAPIPQPKPAPQPVRQVTNSLVRSNGPRQQGQQQFIMQGNQLYPVRQNMARQNMSGHRPMMGSRPRTPMRAVHPAPLPPMPNPQPNSPNWKLLPPRPALKISRVTNGIVLSWNMNLNLATHATIASYQLYAYQESAVQRPDSSLWKKVGDVKALPLPMACTLTQFTRGNKYHFAVRAMDAHSRVGQFSDPNSIVLN